MGFCVIQLSGWASWWQEIRQGHLQMYVSIVLFFLSAVLARPIARTIFVVIRRFTPAQWEWPDDARKMMMWQTALLCRAGLFWIALVVSKVDYFLCQWPSWLFGFTFIIWMDSAGNVLREGTDGYTEDEKVGRKTVIYEGTTESTSQLTKIIFLILVVYTYYINSFIDNDSYLRLFVSAGFFATISISVIPLMRNLLGAHDMFLGNMITVKSHVHLEKGPLGVVEDAPLGYIVVKTNNQTQTFFPAGGTMTSTTELLSTALWPLELEIRLPSHLTVAKVRAFLQDLDLLLFSNSALSRSVAEYLESSARVRMRSRFGSTADRHMVSSAEELIKESLQLGVDQDQDVFTRARGEDQTLALVENERWVIRFRALFRAKESHFQHIQAKYIEEVTKLIEAKGIANASALTR
ncbi:TPA: hypothetical protein N0F65_008514 [Lagenidium giganteum]|uniref:Uncharacterized protein n=1 Tax=Lagenidium giganteum TaxID=4803 RepID=A0AAV2Z3L4_9STRA|nr:TPA: hypothetical protein N0F65_008514 [Lagenidium giganteum]